MKHAPNGVTEYSANGCMEHVANGSARVANRVGSRVFVLLVVVWAATARPAGAQPGAIPAIDSLLQSEVDREHVAGAVVQVSRLGQILHRGAYGFAQRYAHGRDPLDQPDPMTPDHLFDLASLTKVFATTFGVMIMVDRGLIELDAPLQTYLPDFTGGGKDSITVQQLLTHTSGLTEWTPLYYEATNSEEAYRAIVERPLRYAVGAGRHYSDLGFMLLGYLIEGRSGRPLDEFLRENLYEPLDLRNTLFNPLEHGIDPSRIAATSHGNPFERQMVHDDEFGYRVDVDPDSWNGWRHYTLRGEVNDGNAFHAHNGLAGHAGLFSTVDDLQVLLDLMVAGGQIDGDTLISPNVIHEFLAADSVSGNGLGWATDPAVISAQGAPKGTFGHTGFTGTSVVGMPEHDLSIILLTNRQNVGPDDAGRYYDLSDTRQQIVTLALDFLDLRPQSDLNSRD